jgi:hypothetical protein
MKLVDFYNETVRNNDCDFAGWSTLYYGVLSKVVNENNFKKVAEVGIGYGTHAKQLLRNTNLEELYLIDPTKYYPNDGFAEDIMKKEPVVPGNQFNELYELIKKELSPWKNRWTWFRKESLTITNDEVPDGSLDCVFVDGDHSYLAALNDLRFWWKKVRSGGQMLGDDYWMEDVCRAVKEFSNEIGVPFDLLTRDDKDYKIFRFKKN